MLFNPAVNQFPVLILLSQAAGWHIPGFLKSLLCRYVRTYVCVSTSQAINN